MQYHIVIDASHGGDDIGLIVHKGKEKEIVLEISKYMYQKMKQHGVDVSMTRVDDTTLSLEKRIQKIQELHGDSKQVIVISNHLMNQKGIHVIPSIEDNSHLVNLIKKHLLNEKVKCYHKCYGLNMRKDYYPLQRQTANMQVLIIKYGLNLERNYLDQNVDDIVKAVLDYIGDVPNNKSKSINSLLNIAQKMDISVDGLKEIGGFNDNLLRNDDEITYIIKSGENLNQVANKFKLKIEDIMKLNNLKSNLVPAGTKIIIKLHFK